MGIVKGWRPVGHCLACYHQKTLQEPKRQESQWHATLIDIQGSEGNIKDKIGNNKSDGLADLGVRSINGIGLVRLGLWFARRHDADIKFMTSVHRMVAAVTTAEKRDGRPTTKHRRSSFGYDHSLWSDTTTTIRNMTTSIHLPIHPTTTSDQGQT